MTSDSDVLPSRSLPVARRRRILVLGPAREGLGGVAAVMATLAEGWPDRNHELRHLATTVEGGKGRKLAAALGALAQLAALRLSGRADAVHIHFAAGASFLRKSLFILAAKALGLPVVGHAHSGLFPAFYARQGGAGRAAIRFVLGRIDRLVVLSDEWAAFYRGLYRRGEPVVVPNPALIPAVAERPSGPPVLLALGRLGRNKGTYDILAALPAILARHPDAELWLGGDGEVAEVQALAAAQPWGGRVKLLGWVAGAEKDRALRAAHIFLLPSYAEGLPMALLEAMGHGVPVVTTPVGGIPQAVSDGVTGRLITPGDVPALTAAVVDLLDHPERAAAIGAAARTFATERYDRRKIQARLGSLYDGLFPVR